MAKEGFFTRFMKDDILPSVGKYFKAVLDREVKGLEKKVSRKVENHMAKIFLTFTMFFGLLFVMVGFAFLVEDFVSFPRGSGFVLVGLIISLSAFIIKASK